MDDPLVERLLQELKRRPGQKANELAHAIGADRRQVNKHLAHTLAGKVQQDQTYRWRLRDHSYPSAGQQPANAAPPSELARLCRYYLECIGQDSDEGVSTFAANRYGEPEYAELPALPIAGTDWDWWNSPGAGRVLSKVRADKTNLVAWLGYPVRLRKHRTAKWEGYFVEPVMLWAIVLPENPGDAYRLQDDLPTANFAFLRSLAMGDAQQVVEEAARLADELGLNSPLEDQPEVDELLHRLTAIRPDWDWREGLDLGRCSEGQPLSTIDEAGIYNRAVILPGKRSPYTQGLESELKLLGDKEGPELAATALGQWLSGEFKNVLAVDTQPLIEVLPMNSEQRSAVLSALSGSHTVVTGPPGTGKSQVVTNLLVNAAWRGMKVLFASKNNKAVDVVEARVNGLGNRPVLLRLGAKEYQAKLASYLAAMLSGKATNDDEVSYQEGLERHKQFASRLTELDHAQQRTLTARNLVDRLDAEAEDYRALFGADRFNTLDASLLTKSDGAVQEYLQAVDALDPAQQGWIGRIVGTVLRGSRVAALSAAAQRLKAIADHLGISMPELSAEPDLRAMRRGAASVSERAAAGKKVASYQKALEMLRGSPAFEDIARQRQELTEQVAANSTGLWRDWVQMAPGRLTPAQRKDVADYAALLQLITAPDGQNVGAAVSNKARALQHKVTALFSCWAVTSLSARGKVPFEAGYFDLAVIDEASQCDIASALPLLFRAKRTVIIGDPMQLRHISAVTRQKEGELQQKYDHVENRAAWMYSVNSLYDLAAGVASADHIINLRDHHRSHADIIEFSNRAFYEGKLRVATRYKSLKRPRNREPGVIWQDVRGKTIRPSNGGAQNAREAAVVLTALHDLLVVRNFLGTVGVVTPFRAQAQLMQELLAQHPALVNIGARAELLVDTVHRFQGDERDVMIFSPVISVDAPPGAISFLRSNGNLFNVAITRARGLLHVVGDRAAALASGVDYLAQFAEYVGHMTTDAATKAAEATPSLGADYPAVSRPERVSDWERLFYRELFQAGVRPIPQFTVEQFDLDFAVVVGNRRLNIEVDGERYHRSWTGELCLRDQLRNQRLIELGWEVKRFWVYEIRDRLPECVKQVHSWVTSARSHQLTVDQDSTSEGATT
jgi:very-short-patch-repair endonuclease